MGPKDPEGRLEADLRWQEVRLRVVGRERKGRLARVGTDRRKNTGSREGPDTVGTRRFWGHTTRVTHLISKTFSSRARTRVPASATQERCGR